MWHTKIPETNIHSRYPSLGITSDYTILDQDYTILIDASSNTVTITLPSSPLTGKVYNIACLNSDNTVEIDFNGKLLYTSSDNERLYVNENLSLQYNGTIWIGV